eukprot:1160473-Pelagomonas_calceolata.AAC.8
MGTWRASPKRSWNVRQLEHTVGGACGRWEAQQVEHAAGGFAGGRHSRWSMRQAPALAPAGTPVRKEVGGHAPTLCKASPFKQAHGQLPPRPPPPRS